MFTWLRRLLCLSPPQHTADTPNHQRPTNPPAINNPGQGLEADRRNDESNLNAVLQNSISVYVETTAVGLVNASGNDSSPEPVKEVIVDVPASAEDTHTDDDTGRQRLVNLLKGTGKTVLTLVDSVSDALPPLKSVASGIKVIVEIAERVEENDVDLNNLSERITEIRRLIAARPDADAQHEGRVVLERTLENISKVLDPLRQQSTLERVLTAPDIAARIHEYLAKVEQALVDYQVSLTQSLHDMGRRQLPLVEDVHAMNAQQLTYDELHLLDKLARVKDAGFNGSDERSRCLEGTRVDILRSIKAWASDPNAKQIYWLNGHAGSGKSTIAQSIAQSLFEEDRLGASFFCSRESQQRGNYKLIFPTLAFQLACSRSPRSTLYKEEMLRVLKKSPDIASQALKDQLAELFVKPVKQSKIEAVIVVDALDECRDDNSVSLVLSFLADVVSSIPSIKFFITSRPEPHIRAGFGLQGLRPVSDVVVLHEVGSASVDHDIRLFLRTEFRELAIRRNDIMDPTIDWPEEAHVEELVSRASGLFIYASTIVKFIDRQGRNPRKQLALVLQSESTRNGLSALDTLYLGILHGAFPYIDEDCFPELPLVLGFLAVACDSLSCAAIAELLGVDAFDLRTILNLLQSVIHVPDNVAHPVRFFHKSFPDFLTSQTRCTDERFLVKADELQYEVTIHCFRLLRLNLKKNICGLPRYSVNDSLPAARRDACITEATRYACRFWADHLLSDPNRRARITTSNSELRSSLQHFATTQQLWWFEVLALLHELRRSVESLDHVYAWLSTCGDQCQTLVRWIHEGQRFILQSFSAVQVSVAHIYHSALLFSPRNALLRKQHSDDLQDEAEVILGVDDVWSAEARTIRGRYTYNILEYSHDGTMLAACVTGIWGYCHVFRASTGERLASFARPNQTNSEVSSISFSIDDEILAMASGSGVLLWNMATGAMITELRPQDGIPIRTITFHPYNANLLLSLDIRGCVRSWNMKTYECDAQFSCDVEDLPVSVRGTMSWLRRPTRSIVLLPSNLGRVELWDVETEMRTKVLTPDGLPNMTKPPREIVSSCDGSIIAANTDEFIGFWDTDSGHLRFQIICPQEKGPFVKSMQFSPTNPMLIALTCATSVFLMNPLKQIKAPEKGSRKLGQSNNAAHSIFATFSPDGRFIASAFEDAHITFWDLNSDDTDAAEVHNPDDHEGSISSAHFSPDGLHIVTASSDKTVKVWNAVYGTLCTTLRGFSSKICNAIFLPDDTYIVSSDEQNHLMIWDWREGDKRWDLDLGIPMGAMGTCDVLFPFAHNGTFGFFSARRYAFETQNIRCWIVTPREDEDGDEDEDGNEDEGGLGCIYLAAKGLTASGPIGDVTIFGEDYVTSIKYEAPDPSNPLALVLTAECKSGRVFKTLWNFPAMTPDSPPILQELDWTRVAEADGSTIIIEDRRDIEPVGLSNILWQQLFYTTYLEGERPFLKSKNENWVLNERNEQILWIPAKNRGRFGRWYGDKLVLEGTSGRLTLLDFSRAKLSSRDPF